MRRARHPERGGGTTMPGPCSEKSASPRDGRGHCRRRRWGTHGPRGVRSPYFFPLACQLTRFSSFNPTCDVPFPPRRPGEYRKGVIPARPLYQGVGGSVWDPDPSRERVGDWGGPDGLGPLLCCRKACHKAKRRVGAGYSTRRHMLGHERPEAVSPARGVALADLQSSIDCQ